MPSTQPAVAVVDDTLRDAMLREQLLIATGVPGVYGLGAVFEDTLLRIDGLIGRFGADDRPEVVRFPPILNRRHFAQSGYLTSFPHLAGTVHSFEGTDRMHSELLRAVAEGQDWSAAFPATAVVLTPAACYPVYPLLAGRLPHGGRLFDVMSYCFRHEPSGRSGTDADVSHARVRARRRSGDRDRVARAWRAARRSVVEALRLETRADVASDPFFGRGGKLLAENQRDQRLKIEVLAPVVERRLPDRDHLAELPPGSFRRAFRDRRRDGTVAHTSCVGFGLERMALAMFRRHGSIARTGPEPFERRWTRERAALGDRSRQLPPASGSSRRSRLA